MDHCWNSDDSRIEVNYPSQMFYNDMVTERAAGLLYENSYVYYLAV